MLQRARAMAAALLWLMSVAWPVFPADAEPSGACTGEGPDSPVVAAGGGFSGGGAAVCAPGVGAAKGEFQRESSGDRGWLIIDGDSTTPGPGRGYAGFEGDSEGNANVVFDACGDHTPGQGEPATPERVVDTATNPNCGTTTTTTTIPVPTTLPIPTTTTSIPPPTLPTTTTSSTTTTTTPTRGGDEPSAACPGGVPAAQQDGMGGSVTACVPGAGAVSGAGSASGGYLVVDGDSSNPGPASGYAGVEASPSGATPVGAGCGDYSPGGGSPLDASTLATGECTPASSTTTTTFTTTSTTTSSTTTTSTTTTSTTTSTVPKAVAPSSSDNEVEAEVIGVRIASHEGPPSTSSRLARNRGTSAGATGAEDAPAEGPPDESDTAALAETPAVPPRPTGSSRDLSPVAGGLAAVALGLAAGASAWLGRRLLVGRERSSA